MAIVSIDIGLEGCCGKQFVFEELVDSCNVFAFYKFTGALMALAIGRHRLQQYLIKLPRLRTHPSTNTCSIAIRGNHLKLTAFINRLRVRIPIHPRTIVTPELTIIIYPMTA